MEGRAVVAYRLDGDILNLGRMCVQWKDCVDSGLKASRRDQYGKTDRAVLVNIFLIVMSPT